MSKRKTCPDAAALVLGEPEPETKERPQKRAKASAQSKTQKKKVTQEHVKWGNHNVRFIKYKEVDGQLSYFIHIPAFLRDYKDQEPFRAFAKALVFPSQRAKFAKHDFPRDMLWFAANGQPYKFSGKTFESGPWSITQPIDTASTPGNESAWGIQVEEEDGWKTAHVDDALHARLEREFARLAAVKATDAPQIAVEASQATVASQATPPRPAAAAARAAATETPFLDIRLNADLVLNNNRERWCSTTSDRLVVDTRGTKSIRWYAKELSNELVIELSERPVLKNDKKQDKEEEKSHIARFATFVNDFINEHVRETESFARANVQAALVNRYQHGLDSISAHSDKEECLGVNPTIVSLSLGATRVMKVTRKTRVVFDADRKFHQLPATVQVPKRPEKGSSIDFELNDGDLFVFGGAAQAFWRHQIDKEADLEEQKKANPAFVPPPAERINFTFRPHS